MRKTIFTFFALLCATSLLAQAPTQLPYQAVIRNSEGALLTDQDIAVQFSIRQSTMEGTVIFQETMTAATSNVGVINVSIGSGTATTGSLADIDWSSGPYFLEIAYDLTGGTNYNLMGSTQLVSVPYTMHARTAAAAVAKSKTDRDGMSAPKAGQLFFCMDCGTEGELQVYNGTRWTNLMGGDVVE
ncbi:MAG: hypothetical protein AAFO94_00300 [Bacteroidota bacterium]